MILTTLKRITKTGFVNFWRNGFLSFAAVVVITLALVTFGGLLLSNAFGQALLANVKDKVDINVYFSLDAQESDISTFQRQVNALPEVASTTYVSSAVALASFQDKWKDNSLVMQGLAEIGDNPFPASLNIKAKDPGQYADIANFLTTKNPTDSSGNPIVAKINYEQNKLIIDRLSSIIPTVETGGSMIALILVLVAVVVVFNTIRLIIYTARDEISVMKLVGASNTYVRGPFVVSGVMYGITSAVFALIILGVFAYWSDSIVLRVAGVDVASNFELVVNIFSTYFIENLAQIALIIFGAGIVLGGLSSYIAARRYLKV